MKRSALYGLFLALLAWAAPALAQVPNLPPNTVYGRLGISAGPAQAIPVASLFNSFGFGPMSTLGIGTGLVSSGGNLNIANQIAAGGPAGTATVVPILTWNAQGQLTVVSSATITPAFSSVTGTCLVTQGCTGITSGTSGGVPYFSSTTGIASSALLTANALTLGGGAGAAPASLGSLGTTTTVLHGNASGAPTFGAVSLTADVTGITPIANGGTAQSTLAAYLATFPKPTIQTFLSGSGTYTTPANVTWIEVILVGGGGGGAGSGTTPGAAGNGGDTCLRASGAACTTPLYDAGGGSLGPTNGATGGGGVISGSGTCNVRALAGANGQPGSGLTVAAGSNGGNSSLGGGGFGAASGGGVGSAAAAGSGSGGGGAASGGTANSGGGGGSGATCNVIITAPAATYTYAVGAAGTAGTAGGGGSAGGIGSAGSIVVIEHYGG